MEEVTESSADSNDNINIEEMDEASDEGDNMDDNGANECDGDLEASSDSSESNGNAIVINGIGDILKMDMKNISVDVVERFDFADLDVAYNFYSWYARVNGFSVRKTQVLRDRLGNVLQQTFVCSREGFREDRGLTLERRKREPRNDTRCGCSAKCRVHIDIVSKRWYVTVFEFAHNHELLDGLLCGLLPAHRKLTATDLIKIEKYKNVGVRPYQTYGAMANSSGGFHKLGFVKKDLYNQSGRQRKLVSSDFGGALKYLHMLRTKDPLMYVAHTVDKDKRLERLFWCDGESRMNYEIFGDVLAFDATYRKNKYNCPFVIFSGVNHHNQTVVFATGLVTRETEETYVWLLDQFATAMNGKAPLSVITDGDVAMKNAIKSIFPKAHHRLCAWHLLRNASSNVGIADFMSYLKRCMLGDMEVNKFEELWEEMVEKFGLQDNNWINEMYAKKRMWATAHIKGEFFAGIRTTSRCEGLHSHIGQFVHSRINLTDFVQQFHRCLTYFRFREIESDYRSNYGQPVLQTSLRFIERSASNQFTREIFFLFRNALKKSLMLRIIEIQEMSMGSIYKVSKYCGNGSVWHVTHCETPVDFKCSCLRMESFGLPCDHIIAVLMYLDFDHLPKNLVLHRWTKFATDTVRARYTNGSQYWDSQIASRYAGIIQLSKDVAERVYQDVEEYNRIVDFLSAELLRLKNKPTAVGIDASTGVHNVVVDESLLDPTCVRTKGCGSNPIATPGGSRRPQSCSQCGVIGHNKRSCPKGVNNFENACTSSATIYEINEDDEEGDLEL